MENESALIEMQAKIHLLYKEKFKNYNENLGLSVPHIPRISANYLENRTIIIGQETNTWYRNGDNGLKDIFVDRINNIEKVCLTDRYDHFVKNYLTNYSGKFWEFNKSLYNEKIIKGNIISSGNLSHCWLNLFVVEACKDKNHSNGRPTKNKDLAAKIMKLQGSLLNEILNILQPKLIIALTGHSLDNILLNNVLSTECKIRQIDTEKILSKEMLAELIVKDEDNFLYNTKIIRCYHPTYFLGKINGNKKLNAELKKNQHKESISKYYKNKVFEILKDFQNAKN